MYSRIFNFEKFYFRTANNQGILRNFSFCRKLSIAETGNNFIKNKKLLNSQHF